MNEKNKIISNWLLKADHDLGTAIVTYQHVPDYKDTIAFHCQQAIEKYLKAYLVHLDIEFRKWHNLIYLFDLISQKDKFNEEYYDKAVSVQNFSIEIRYPNEIIELTDFEIQEAISTAKEFRDLIINKIGISIEYNKIIKK